MSTDTKEEVLSFDGQRKKQHDRIQQLLAAYDVDRDPGDWFNGTLKSVEQRLDLTVRIETALWNYTDSYHRTTFFPDIVRIKAARVGLEAQAQAWASANKHFENEETDRYTSKSGHPYQFRAGGSMTVELIKPDDMPLDVTKIEQKESQPVGTPEEITARKRKEEIERVMAELQALLDPDINLLEDPTSPNIPVGCASEPATTVPKEDLPQLEDDSIFYSGSIGSYGDQLGSAQ